MKDFTQTGRSMVEMLGVLAIIGVLSVGALMGYSSAMEKHTANMIVDEVSHFVANIHSHYQPGKYKGINFKDLQALNAIPFIPKNANMLNNYLTNRVGGKLMVIAKYAPEAELYNKYNEYTQHATINVIYTGLTESLCQKIATYDWRDPNLIGMMIYSDTRTSTGIADTCLHITPVDKYGKIKDEVKCFVPNHETNGIPIPPAKAAAACAACAGKSSCFVAWKYY